MIEHGIFSKGAQIEITRAAHAYSHMGYTDPNCIIPQEVEVMTVTRVSNTKNGVKVHFRRADNTGYAIDVEKSPLHTYRKV